MRVRDKRRPGVGRAVPHAWFVAAARQGNVAMQQTAVCSARGRGTVIGCCGAASP
jgi:hypothetical protein